MHESDTSICHQPILLKTFTATTKRALDLLEYGSGNHSLLSKSFVDELLQENYWVHFNIAIYAIIIASIEQLNHFQLFDQTRRARTCVITYTYDLAQLFFTTDVPSTV